MKKTVEVAGVLLFAVGAMWSSPTQAQKPINTQAGKPPSTVSLRRITIPRKPTPAQLQKAMARINASPAARRELAVALANRDNRKIAAIFKSVNVDVPSGVKFIPAARRRGGCYIMKTVGYTREGWPIIRFVPVRCPPPPPCGDLTCI